MMMPLVNRLLAGGCALLFAALLSSPAEGAFFPWFGYGGGYGGYSTYYGAGYSGYGSSCGGCGSCNQCSGYGGYTTGYRGFGYGFYTPSYTAYAPTYYAPSSCGNACGSSCGSVCGSSCGSPCGNSCDPCGVSYGGFSCGTCGVASCSGGCGVGGCGIASIGCATSDCTSGVFPASGQTVPEKDPYVPQQTPRTFDNQTDDRPDDFQQPARPSGGPTAPAVTNPPSGSGNSGGEVLPSGSGDIFDDLNNGSDFNRESFKPTEGETIERRTEHGPADMEPTEGDESDAAEPGGDEPSQENLPPADVRVRPLDIETEVAAGVTPDRRRAHYAVRFHAPRVARLDVKPSSKWSPIEPETKLAATK